MTESAESLHGWSLTMAAIGLVTIALWLLVAPFVPSPWLAALHGLWGLAGYGYVFVVIQGHRRWADRVTGVRVLVTVLLFAAFALHPWATWWKVALALSVLVLDGVDGKLARRFGPTARGAVFDMESDAFFMITLCGVAYLYLGVGPWVFVLGALRPLYVLAWAVAQRFRPMRSPNRKGSQRARVIFLCTVIALLAALAPGIPLLIKDVATACAAALLCYSFGVDTIALFRPAQPS
jgi:phosphatidylglycerophosphate synthase